MPMGSSCGLCDEWSAIGVVLEGADRCVDGELGVDCGVGVVKTSMEVIVVEMALRLYVTVLGISHDMLQPPCSQRRVSGARIARRYMISRL